MKKILIFSFIASLFVLTSCQNELYRDNAEEFVAPQGIYLSGEEMESMYVTDNQSLDIKSVVVSLIKESSNNESATVEVGSKEQLDAFNKKYNTSYVLLPSDIYKSNNEISFEPNKTSAFVDISIKNMPSSTEGDYALPIRVVSGSADVIKGKNEKILIFERRIKTKSLRINKAGCEDSKMFPDDFKVDQWTMEVMVNRASYSSNNRAICGTKLIANAGPMDEIYTRFGDVTIKTNQLQIKTGASQIDIDESAFAAKPNEWYMLAFVYDGKKNYVYVNGVLVADREIRNGAYGLVGFWLSGENELIREVRFWSVARTAKQINDFAWKMVSPKSEGLLLYYPLNGKKYNHETGEITEDETLLWDWSKNGKNLPMPNDALFDDNGGNFFIFPMEE